MVRWSVVDQAVPLQRGAGQEFQAQQQRDQPPQAEERGVCPACNARTANTIVTLLESRQMVFKIGGESTSRGIRPVRLLPI